MQADGTHDVSSATQSISGNSGGKWAIQTAAASSIRKDNFSSESMSNNNTSMVIDDMDSTAPFTFGGDISTTSSTSTTTATMIRRPMRYDINLLS